MKQNWIYIICAVALTGVVLVLWDTRPKDLLKLDRDKKDSPFYNFPYATLKNTSSKYYDEAGELNYAFDAQKLEHYRVDFARASEDDYMLMHKPVFTILAENQPWHIAADQGKFHDSGETLTLWDNVQIWQNGREGEGKRLTTSELTVKPNEKMIMTDVAVKITSPRGEIEAVGMVVDLNSQKIRLLSDVRGYHEPI